MFSKRKVTEHRLYQFHHLWNLFHSKIDIENHKRLIKNLYRTSYWTPCFVHSSISMDQAEFCFEWGMRGHLHMVWYHAYVLLSQDQEMVESYKRSLEEKMHIYAWLFILLLDWVHTRSECRSSSGPSLAGRRKDEELLCSIAFISPHTTFIFLNPYTFQYIWSVSLGRQSTNVR